MQNSGETENELRPFLQRHDRPILERQRQGRLLLISISGSGGCDAFSPSAHRSSPVSGGGGRAGAVAESGEARFREVLASAHHLLHVPLRMTSVAHQRLDGDDALALSAGDLRPVVRVARVRQVLVLLELLAHRGHQVVGDETLPAAADAALEGEFLRAPHHGLDHRARDEVAEVEDFLLTVGIGNLEELRGLAALRSGRSTLIFTSRRPGRRIAGSIRSGRFDAPMTTTLRSPSTPSTSVRNCGTIVDSTSEEMPVPRVLKSASISSKKITTGTSSAAFSLAF